MDGCSTNLCLGTELISLYETGGGIGVPRHKKGSEEPRSVLIFQVFVKLLN